MRGFLSHGFLKWNSFFSKKAISVFSVINTIDNS
nr:MAG TPA: hypothetical protein [Caudoviricetes sp.]